MSVWDDAKKNLVDWYAVTADKTTELAKVTSRKYDKFGLSRDIERQFSELGALVYTGLQEEREGILEDEAVAALIERIAGLEEELRLKDEEIERIKRDHAERKSAAATADKEVPTVMNDPALDKGTADSSILVEPSTEEAAAEFVEVDGETERDDPEVRG